MATLIEKIVSETTPILKCDDRGGIGEEPEADAARWSCGCFKKRKSCEGIRLMERVRKEITRHVLVRPRWRGKFTRLLFGSGGSSGKRRNMQFGYDPRSYALNFDDKERDVIYFGDQ